MNRFWKQLTIGLCLAYALINFVVLLRMVSGIQNPGWVVLLATGVCFIFSVLHAWQRLGGLPALTLLCLCFVISLLFESVGVATGLVYGPYHYTDLLGPKFLGLVPYIIPLAWFMMIYASFLIARSLTPKLKNQFLHLALIAAIGGVVMTSWDLMMDPLMVAGGHWVWVIKGAYFGIPLQNFFGWWLTTFVTYGLFLLIWPAQRGTQINLKKFPPTWDRWVYLSYLITGVGNGATAAVSGLSGPALVGLFTMGPWLLMAWWKSVSSSE